MDNTKCKWTKRNRGSTNPVGFLQNIPGLTGSDKILPELAKSRKESLLLSGFYWFLLQKRLKNQWKKSILSER